jgi:hypothetical protein
MIRVGIRVSRAYCVLRIENKKLWLSDVPHTSDTRTPILRVYGSNRTSRYLVSSNKERISTDLINALPGNSSVNTVQHATIKEPGFSVDPTDAPVDWLDSDHVICVYSTTLVVVVAVAVVAVVMVVVIAVVVVIVRRM